MAAEAGPRPVIDMAGMLLDRECWEAYLLGFAETAEDYFRVFGPRLSRMAGLDPREFAALARRDPQDAVTWLLSGGAFDLDLDAYAARLAGEGVRHQVLLSNYRPLRGGGVVNDRVAEFVAKHPTLFEGWGCVDLSDPDGAIAEIRRCAGQLGMRGAAVSHFLTAADPLSEGAHAFYDVLEELGLPLWVHTGHNLSSRLRMDWCTWRELDAIAVRHPGLVLVAGHGGWPWIPEMMALCQRHPNVYLEFSTYRPHQMKQPGSGWEPLFAHGTSTVRHKILFGGLEWIHGRTTGQLAAEAAEFDIDERCREAWLYGNAARLLGWEEPS
ncbi:amidohydrolase family protein [Amycolatopsis cynarae]|uniref:Amidohydrolase family protein n=1 Tax=Amycolatopsis cynarae TaxID=2995223 RepID=A0ABY7AXB0_9PSEU|nr:amidohydrolase family protein [Amycolatopsis sp. HUAS 11-8]WAL63547.1 amidohydrolase family protein [Amycolatopsis sp. HUAS 11-8]